MLTLTIKDALERGDETNMHQVYVYREGETAFYVGRSIHPFERLQQHLGNDVRNPYPDAVGLLILNNQPVSLTWTIQIATIQELAPNRYKRIVETGSNDHQLKSLAEDLETIWMNFCKPCLNATGHHTSTPLPKRYQRIANEGIKISEE